MDEDFDRQAVRAPGKRPHIPHAWRTSREQDEQQRESYSRTHPVVAGADRDHLGRLLKINPPPPA